MVLDRHKIAQGNSFNSESIKSLMGEKLADLVVLDPPYGVGVGDWDKSEYDIDTLLESIIPIMGKDSFLALFIQMPLMVDWLVALRKTELKFKDHISWVKRISSTSMLPLNRTHESVFICRKGNPNYVETKGKYTDIKLPSVLFDVVNIESVFRYIEGLRSELRGNKSIIKGSKKSYKCYKYMNTIAYPRSPEYCNFTNVWSFLAENHYRVGGRIEHPTVKPLKLMERLICLCTEKGGLVVDLFLGSGSTLVACHNTERICYGQEFDHGYCEMAIDRWNNRDKLKQVELFAQTLEVKNDT